MDKILLGGKLFDIFTDRSHLQFRGRIFARVQLILLILLEKLADIFTSIQIAFVTLAE